MKKSYFLFVAILMVLSTTTLSAQRRDGRVLFVANLDGSQEIPSKAIKAKGLITVMLEENGSLTVSGVFDSLSGPATGCHFHTGDSKTNGAIIQELTPGINAKGNGVTFTVPNAPSSLISGILNSQVYLNVHTAANPGGEIRGVPVLESDTHYTTFLSGANEVPAVTTKGYGLLSMVLSKNSTTIDVKAVMYGLSGAITASHFHTGAVGKTGPVVVPLTVTGNVVTGTFIATQSFLDSLKAGLVYMNVHTAANGSGEIRGQVALAPTSFGFDAFAEGANEIPAVASDAKSIMVGTLNSTLDTLSYTVLYSGLTTTAGHFHDGAKGVAGAVIQEFTRDTAFTNVYRGKFPLTLANRVKLITGNLYINMHTATNPGGEIRGQVYSSIREGMVANMCSGQEPTPNSSTGIGLTAVSVNRLKTDVAVNLVVTGLTANASAGHIHKGLKGANGPVYVPFALNADNTVKATYILSTTGGGDSIINGQSYANVHTPINSGGEIRGQVDKTLNGTCLTTGIFDLNGAQFAITVSPNPSSDVVNVSFEANLNTLAQLTLSDIAGRTVISKNLEVINGSNHTILTTADLPNGIYFIQLRNKNQLLFTEKWVKD